MLPVVKYKVSHALRFAHIKENRKSGKRPKQSRRRSSTSSHSNTKEPSPEERALWNTFVIRQQRLLEAIKKGNKKGIPAFVELPDAISLSKVVSDDISDNDDDDGDGDGIGDDNDDDSPLSINDKSFEHNPAFQDYCLQLYRMEEEYGIGTQHLVMESRKISSKDRKHQQQLYAAAGGQTVCRQPSCQSGSDGSSTGSDIYCTTEDDIVTMISGPLMEWDMEHDGIFEV